MIKGVELGSALHEVYAFARRQHRQNLIRPHSSYDLEWVTATANPTRKQEVHELVSRGQELVRYFSQTEGQEPSLVVAQERFARFMDFVMPRQVRELMEEVGQKMTWLPQGPFKHGNFVVLNSGGFGGMHARLVAGREHVYGKQDIDVMFFYDKPETPISDEALAMMDRHFAAYLANPNNPELPRNHYHPCEFLLFPSRTRAYNFDMKTITQRLRTMTAYQDAYDLVRGLLPSFPKSNNAEIILAGLQQLAKEDPGAWMKAISFMEEQWNLISVFKSDYFANNGWADPDFVREYDPISEEIGRVRNAIFSDMLRATAL